MDAMRVRYKIKPMKRKNDDGELLANRLASVIKLLINKKKVGIRTR